MQALLCTLREYCFKWRLIVNVGKTKCMVFHQNGVRPTFTDGGEVIELVDNFKYLGLLFATVSETSYKKVPYLSIMQHRLQQGKRLIAGSVEAAMCVVATAP